MKRSLAPVLLLLPLLSVPAATAPATGADVTCQGQPATIVGVPSRTVEGTDDGDVIVADRPLSVDAGAGDDLVCIVGVQPSTVSDRWQTLVLGGAGEDDIVVTASRYRRMLEVDLGPGDDDYDSTAGDGPDYVTTGSGSDTIRTGTGNDTVLAFAKRNDREPVTPTVFHLGGGDDTAFYSTDVDVSGTTLIAGGGYDRLDVAVKAGDDLVLDASTHTATLDGRTLASRWAGFEVLQAGFGGEAGARALDVRGTVGRDGFVAFGAHRITGGLGRGDDHLIVSPAGSAAGAVGGGPGRDTVETDTVRFVDAPVLVDLAAGVLSRPGPGARRLRISGFSDVVAGSRGIVRGDEHDNRLHTSCGRSYGDAGNDLIVDGVVPTYDPLRPVRVDRRALCSDELGQEAYGGTGRDRLVGAGSRDLLVGGPGFDRVDGGFGRDTCQGERRTSCEVERR